MHVAELMQSIFSGQGRYNRAKYFYMSLLVAVPFAVIAVVTSYALPVSNSIVSLLSIVYSVVMFPIGVKRLHDLNVSDGFYILCLIPGPNVIMMLFLLFKKGARGPNKYGPDPLSSI
jgi:uncharacterized membrane protein YhaH (DUF805 family)